jgi:hypothetical protein
VASPINRKEVIVRWLGAPRPTFDNGRVLLGPIEAHPGSGQGATALTPPGSSPGGVVLIWTSHGEARDIHMQTTLRNEQISVRLNPDVVSKAP